MQRLGHLLDKLDSISRVRLLLILISIKIGIVISFSVGLGFAIAASALGAHGYLNVAAMLLGFTLFPTLLWTLHSRRPTKPRWSISCSR